MPVVPLGGWKRCYLDFVTGVLELVPLERLTLGGITMDRHTRLLMESWLGTRNVTSNLLEERVEGKWYYPKALWRDLFQQIRSLAKRIQPNLQVEIVIP